MRTYMHVSFIIDEFIPKRFFNSSEESSLIMILQFNTMVIKCPGLPQTSFEFPHLY